jgi:hypothetical protein
MANYGVAVTWGDAKPGREGKALDLFSEAITTNEKAVANGLLESWDAVVFEPSATPPAGVIRLLATSREKLDEFINSDEFQDQVNRATLLLNAVGIRRFLIGDALLDSMGKYSELLKTL